MKCSLAFVVLICAVGCKTYEHGEYVQHSREIVTPSPAPATQVVVKHEYDGPWPYYWRPYVPAPAPQPAKQVEIQVVQVPATQPVVSGTTTTKNVIQVLPIKKIVIYTTTQPSTTPVITPPAGLSEYEKLRIEQGRYWWDR